MHHKIKKKNKKTQLNMEKVNKTEKNEPIMPVLKSMEVGDTHTYPCSRMNTVKSIVSQVQVTTGKSFKTKLEKPYLHVTRTA